MSNLVEKEFPAKALMFGLRSMGYSFSTFTVPAEDVVVEIETKGAQMMPVYDVRFTADDEGNVFSKDYGTEYVCVGAEGRVGCFGKWEFVGHIEGEEKRLNHMDGATKTGMYSVDGSKDVMIRYFPDNEFAFIYARKDLLKTGVSLDNCIMLGLVEWPLFNSDETAFQGNLITECEQFFNEIKSGPRAKEAGLYDLVIQPNGYYKNCYLYGYICGIIQEDVNIVIPMVVTSFDDKAYSITIDDVEYVLPQEWFDRFVKRNTADHTSPVFRTENISRVTFYGYYGEGEGMDVSADDMAEIVAWLGTFTLGKSVGGEPIAPGTNTYYVEIEYADGAIVKNGLDVIKVYGTSYYLDSDIPPDCFMDIIYQINY